MNPKKLSGLYLIGACAFGVCIAIASALATVPQPGLTISTPATNQFSIVITNGVSITNYTLFWSESLNDVNYPWRVISVGGLGQTNFSVNAEGFPIGYFEILVGSDRDTDGIPDSVDADPNDAAVGALSLTIAYPANGSTIE
jgi:hypothetical protein